MTRPTTTRLRNLPAIRAEAERLAVEHWAACRAALEDWNKIKPGEWTWDDIDPLERELNTTAQLHLLTDLSRPESRDALVRMGIENDKRWRTRGVEPCAHLSGWGEYVRPNGHRSRIYGTPQLARRKMMAARRRYWHALRDDSEALAAALLEVLS